MNTNIGCVLQILLKVADINNCSPKFENAVYSRDIAENTKVGESVLTVSAIDCDFSVNNSHVTYSLSPAGKTNLDTCLNRTRFSLMDQNA